LAPDVHGQRKTNRHLRPLAGGNIPVLYLNAGEEIMQEKVADYPCRNISASSDGNHQIGTKTRGFDLPCQSPGKAGKLHPRL
jgi:hypothetical protein